MESSSVCPWDEPEPTSKDSVISVSVCPWEDDTTEPPPSATLQKYKYFIIFHCNE